MAACGAVAASRVMGTDIASGVSFWVGVVEGDGGAASDVDVRCLLSVLELSHGMRLREIADHMWLGARHQATSPR